MVASGGMGNSRKATIDREDPDKDDEQSPTDQNEGFDHVAPDDPFDPTKEGINDTHYPNTGCNE